MNDFDYRSCAQVFSRLDDWVDRELSTEDLGQIQRHLEICARCASEFRVEGDLLRTLKAKVRRIQLPPGFEARVWRRVTASPGGDGPQRTGGS